MGNNKPEDGAGCTSLPNHITHRINTAFLADELDPHAYNPPLEEYPEWTDWARKHKTVFNTNEYNFEVEKQKIDEFVAGQSPARLDELVDYGRVNGGEFRDAFLARPIEEQIYFMRQVCRARHKGLFEVLSRSKFYIKWATKNKEALFNETATVTTSAKYEPDAEGLYIPRRSFQTIWDTAAKLAKENKDLEAKVKALEEELSVAKNKAAPQTHTFKANKLTITVQGE